MTARGHPEADFQKALVRLLRLALPRRAIVHATNLEVRKGGREGAKAQAIETAMGAHKGFPDVQILVGGRVAFIECKAARNGLSEEQAAFRDDIRAQGHTWVLGRTLKGVMTDLRKAGFPLLNVEVGER